MSNVAEKVKAIIIDKLGVDEYLVKGSYFDPYHICSFVWKQL